MNNIKTLQAKFTSYSKANEWINKKMASGKWTNGKITSAMIQVSGGENVVMYFASLQNSHPTISPYTQKPIGETKFIRV